MYGHVRCSTQHAIRSVCVPDSLEEVFASSAHRWPLMEKVRTRDGTVYGPKVGYGLSTARQEGIHTRIIRNAASTV